MSMLAEPPDTYAHHVRMTRIYLFEARKTIHRNWKFTLLAWATERRRRAIFLKKIGPAQPDLFGD